MTTVLTSLGPVPLEVTYDQVGLSVAMRILKWDTVNWVQDGPLVPCDPTPALNTYAAIFTPPRVGLYICELMVYTDNTLTTPQDGYYPSSRSFAVDLSLTNQLTNIETILTSLAAVTTSAVNPSANIIGELEDDATIVGTVSNEGDIVC
jgi:hypothetical protein